MYQASTPLTYLSKLVSFVLIILCVTSCSFDKKIDAFYICTKNNDKFKLSMERKKVSELQKIIAHYDSLTENTGGEINPIPGFFTEYSIVGKTASGMKVIERTFVKEKSFGLCYMIPKYVTCTDLENKSHQMVLPMIELYSIENFFSPEEKKMMEILVPEWPTNMDP